VQRVNVGTRALCASIYARGGGGESTGGNVAQTGEGKQDSEEPIEMGAAHRHTVYSAPHAKHSR
jgi:hypothetical protein